MLKKTFYIGLPLLFIILLVYYSLGGFNETEIKLMETEDYIIAGYTYRGPYDEDVLQDLFFQARDYVDREGLAGTITVLNYGKEFTNRDSVHQLIGVRLEAAPLQLPENMQVDTIPGGQVVRALIEAHPLVMPHPQDTYKKISSFSGERSLALREISIEQYVGESELWVDIPLR